MCIIRITFHQYNTFYFDILQICIIQTIKYKHYWKLIPLFIMNCSYHNFKYKNIKQKMDFVVYFACEIVQAISIFQYALRLQKIIMRSGIEFPAGEMLVYIIYKNTKSYNYIYNDTIIESLETDLRWEFQILLERYQSPTRV